MKSLSAPGRRASPGGRRAAQRGRPGRTGRTPRPASRTRTAAGPRGRRSGRARRCRASSRTARCRCTCCASIRRRGGLARRRDVPRRGQQQADRELGGADDVGGRGVDDHDARLGGRLDVDVVETDAGPGDDLEPLGGREGLGVDLRGAADQDRVDVGDGLDAARPGPRRCSSAPRSPGPSASTVAGDSSSAIRTTGRAGATGVSVTKSPSEEVAGGVVDDHVRRRSTGCGRSTTPCPSEPQSRRPTSTRGRGHHNPDAAARSRSARCSAFGVVVVV